MGDWDASDDEWDASDVEAKLEAKEKEAEKQRRRDDGLDSESEEEVKVSAPAVRSAPKKKKEKQVAAQPDPEEGLTAQEKALRLRRLQEEQEERMAADMFAGCSKVDRDDERGGGASTKTAAAKAKSAEPAVVVVDAFDKLELKVQADVESLCNSCVTKLEKSKCKGVAIKFLCDLVKQIEGEIELKDLESLDKAVTGYVKDRKAAKGAIDMKDNKANTKLNKNTKFNTHDEYSCIYGGGGDDEEWTQEEWDEWEKQQAAAYSKWEMDEAAKKQKSAAQKQSEQQEWEAAQQEIIADTIKQENKAKAKAKPKAESADSDPLPGQAAPKGKAKKK